MRRGRNGDYRNEVPGWVDLERLLNAVVHNFELLFSNYSHFIDSHGSIMWNVKVIHLIHVFGKEDAMDMIEKKVIQFVSCE